MKVFLKKDVPGLGKANQVKKVSDGYARNYLFPHGLAVAATAGQLKKAELFAETQKVKEKRLRERSLQIVERLKGETLRFKVKAGEKGRLYGSITSAEVAKAIARLLGDKFDKRCLVMSRPIREIGMHVIDIKLDAGVRGQARVVVEAEA